MSIKIKKSGRWRKVKLGFFITFALVVTGELVSRFVLGLGSPPLVIEHQTIEYMFRPNQDVWRFHNRQYYNRFGMRSEDFDKKRSSPNEMRLLIFGDSVINGGNLTDQDDLATSIVDKKLEARFNSDRVIVGNISAGSWGPGNQLAYSREYGFFSADIIILVISSHDATDIPQFKKLNPNTHPTSAPISALAEGIQRYLPRYLPSWNSHPPKGEQGASRSKIKRGLMDLRNFLTEAKATGSRVVVVQYLDRDEITSGKLEPGFEEIRKVCNQLQIPTVSTQELFKEAVSKSENPFRDAIHPNDLGQKLLAACILEAIGDTHKQPTQERGKQSDELKSR